ncbi:hypothetical protein GOP47_0020372 [Adiantum capillus-veneris]|uniref:C2 domain-containing protein n=1 Tax=Adiantum capillus-veneris TaxID=13818 RepID=A0A9D4Z9I0_ADICA|nr:hypothetical protein GOP47_0020372 [Adiantum capillus-veneris]
MPQQPKIELTVMAAEGLKNVSLMRTKMAPYAVAFVEPYSKHSTRVLAKAGKDPIWNDIMHITIPVRLLNDPSATLTIQVFSQGTISTSLAGATQLLLQDLLRHAALKGNGEGDILTLQLFRPSGRAHGIIRIFLKLSGDGLPDLPRLLGDDFDVACHESTPATGIPIMPTMGIHSATSTMPAEHSIEKYSYPYPAPSYVHSTYLPYPTPPSPCPRRNSNFLFGLVSGAVAAVLLGSFF